MKKTFMKLTSVLFVAALALISTNAQAGCNDVTACNYNPGDTDALDCVYEGFTLTVGGSTFDAEIGWQLFDSGGGLVDEGIAYAGGSPVINTYCLPDDCYDFVMTDAFGDGWNGGTATFESYDGATVYLTTTLTNNGPTLGSGPETVNVGIGSAACVVAGCTDPGACNYTLGNNQDDGSCEYLTCAGCTNPDFCEFDPAATIEDGSCATIVGCFDPLSCLFDAAAACGDQVALCAQIVNDTCGGAIDFNGGLPLITGSYTLNADNNQVCVDEVAAETNGVWFTFTTPATPSTFTFTCQDDGSGFWDNQMEIYDACGAAISVPGSFDDFGGINGYFDHFMDCGTLLPSTTYYLMVDGWNAGAIGSCDVTITCDAEVCITGCTNPLALNFDPGALIPCDNGGGPNDCCVIPDCIDAPLNTVYCYGNNANEEFYCLENDPTESVVISFNAGQIESATFDVITIYDGISTADPILYTNAGIFATTDLSGIIVESTAGSGGILITLTTDGSVSCATSGYIPWDYDSYCCTPAILGCTDPAALNYNPDPLVVDDGSCIVPCCPDPPVTYSYCYGENEDAQWGYQGTCGPAILQFTAGQIESATFDIITIYDGSDNTGPILYTNAGIFSTTDLTGVTVEGLSGFLYMTLTTDASVSCQGGSFTAWSYDVYCSDEIVFGCDDPAACNYDINVDINDGSCCFENCVNINLSGGLNNFDLFWFLEASDGTNVFGPGAFQGAPYDELVCLVDDCYTMRILSSFGNGWPGGTITITDFGGSPIYTSDFASGEGDGGYLSLHLFQVGSALCATCQDANACNYDPTGIYADCDACEYVTCAGCTYSFSPDYDPAATYDDGSCGAPVQCPGDADGNGAVNVLDLVAVSSNFGSTCP